MPSQSSQLSFLAGKSISSSQSTQETSPASEKGSKQIKQSYQLTSSKYANFAQATAKQSEPTFNGIPQELRDLIYHHIFANAVIHVSRRHRATSPSIKSSSNGHVMLWMPKKLHPDDKDYKYYESGCALSILSVSRDIRRDAIPYYLTNAVFQVHGPSSMCANWVNGFGLEDRRLLKEVRYSDPNEHMSVLAGALRKTAAKESPGGVRGDMARLGVTLSFGILRVRSVDDGRIKWKSA